MTIDEDEMNDVLKQMGQMGFELVAVVGLRYIFKKYLGDFKEEEVKPTVDVPLTEKPAVSIPRTGKPPGTFLRM